MKNKFIFIIALIVFAIMISTACASLRAIEHNNACQIAATTLDGRLFFTAAKGPPDFQHEFWSQYSSLDQLTVNTMSAALYRANMANNGSDQYSVQFTVFIIYSVSTNELIPEYIRRPIPKQYFA